MDVRCGQCGTDYEFDDALLSSRGTMVRCTTCGHQFKVFPVHTVGPGTDRWLIEKTSGEHLVFTSLKDLQRAIGAGLVRRQDVLTRDGEVRQVGSIAELDSLFRKRQAPAHDPRTLMGIAPSRARSAALSPEPHEPPVPTEAHPEAPPQSEPGEDDVTKVVESPPEPPVPTPSVGVEIPELARATPPEPAKDEAAEQPVTSPKPGTRAASPTARLAEEPTHEAPPTPRSPAGPEGPPVGERPAAAEAGKPVAWGRYAETLRSEESVLSAVSSASADQTSERGANGSAPGAKPIAHITTQRVAVRRERPGASTMRSSDWGDGSRALLAAAAASDTDLGEPSESLAHDAAAAVEAPNDGVEADERPKVGLTAGSVKLDLKAEKPQAAAGVDLSTKPNAEAAKPPSKAADAEIGSTAARAAATPVAPVPPAARAAERAPQTADASKSVRDVPRAAEPEPAATSAAKPDPATERPAARDARAPSSSTERRPQPVSAEPTAQSDRQRARVAAAAPRPRMARTWIGLALAVAALAAAAYLSAPIWLPPTRPVARTESSTSSSAELDARVARARELIDTGDLAAAKQQLDSALNSGRRDARLVLEAARWHLATAELAWWRSRMYGAGDGALSEVGRDLRTKLASAEAALARAQSLGALPPALRWARPALDRMAGNLIAARQHTTALTQTGLDAPEYAQAALAVAGGSSDWAMAARQLGKAASIERSLGPSRLGLVFVLAMSGRIDEARVELSGTARQPATQALVQELESFLQRSSAANPDAGVATEARTAESSAAPDGDFRRQLTNANEALRAGQVTRAERLYRSVLDTVPGNTEALSGLADVARARNDSATALQMYQRVLEGNPGYIPALMAVADQKWQSGDRRGAAAYYRRVLDQAGDTSSYGARASQRLREMDTRTGSQPVSDAGPSGAPRSGEAADRPLPTGDGASQEATKPARDTGAQPSGRSPRPRRTGSQNPKDFVP